MAILGMKERKAQTNGNGNGDPGALAQLEAEAAGLRNEAAQIDELLSDGDAAVDALERALVRKQALAMRLQAVDAKIAGERARIAAAEKERRRAEAAALGAEAEAVIREAVDALLVASEKAERHMDLMRRQQSLTGEAGWGTDGRGRDLWTTCNSLVQALQPGRFYPVDQAGTLRDRESSK